eukprot:2593733-Rhodomonas_salina.1
MTFSREWIEAAKAERQNLKKHKTFEILSKTEVRDLILHGVRIHTCRNVMKKKLDELGRQYQHKCSASFRGFTQIERYDFHETLAAVASSAVVRL